MRKIFLIGAIYRKHLSAESGNTLLFVAKDHETISFCLSVLRTREIRTRETVRPCREAFFSSPPDICRPVYLAPVPDN